MYTFLFIIKREKICNDVHILPFYRRGIKSYSVKKFVQQYISKVIHIQIRSSIMCTAMLFLLCHSPSNRIKLKSNSREVGRGRNAADILINYKMQNLGLSIWESKTSIDQHWVYSYDFRHFLYLVNRHLFEHLFSQLSFR